MTEQQLKTWFVEAVDTHPSASSELKRSLRNKKTMINNYIKVLHKELNAANRHLQLKKNKSFKTDTMRDFTRDMANNFVLTMEKSANERIQSEIKRLSIEKKKQDEVDMAATFAGKPQGELKEYVDEGSLILDETQLQRPDTAIKAATNVI